METDKSKRKLFRMIIPMYPTFNIYSRVADKTTALGPVCVATCANKMPDWDVENNYHFYGPRTKDGSPDHNELQRTRPASAVGFYGGLTSTVSRLYKVAQFYQERGVLTIGGGYHVDNMSEEALNSGIDVVVHGEGDETITELLEVVDGRRSLISIPGISFKENGQIRRTSNRAPITDFDRFPLPDFGLLRYAHVSVFPINRTRGCGMNCEFCAVKGKARHASPERLLAQITKQVETYDAKEFFVVDDLFTQDKNGTLRFCKLLADYQRRIGKRLILGVQIRLDSAKNTEILKAMRQANIDCVYIGYESVIKEELKAMNKRLNVKDMLWLTQRLRRFGFLIHGMFIFGYPMREGVNFRVSAKERVRHFKSFIKKSRLDTVQTLLPVPLPGTALRQRLLEQRRIFDLRDIGWEYYDGNFPLFIPDAPMTPEEMQNSIVELMSKFYRFQHLPAVWLRTLSFPFAMLPLVNLKKRWWEWYRSWRSHVIGFGGWLLMKRWLSHRKKIKFLEHLRQARHHLTERREMQQHLPVQAVKPSDTPAH